MREGVVAALPAAVAGLAAVGTWKSAGSGDYTRVDLSLWLAAVVAWFAAWWPRGVGDRSPLAVRVRGALPTAAALASIVAVGAFFRFYRLGSVP